MQPETTPTPAPAFTAVAVPGVAHLRRVVGPHGACGWCPAGEVPARLEKLNALYDEARRARARGMR